MTLQTQRVQTLEQVRRVAEGNEAVDFALADRASAYEFIRRTLVQFDYAALGTADKGAVKAYLAKMTGLSRAQLTRLMAQHRSTGHIRDRRSAGPSRPFTRRYTAPDIRLLAEVDTALGQRCGPATRAVLRRQYEVFADERFARLAGLSNGHLYNLRASRTYRSRRSVFTKTRARVVAIAERRKPRPMDRYVLAKLGAMPVDKVGSAAVYEVLRPIALAGKHATVKMAGTAITAVLEWARIAEFRAEGSPVETVRRRLPKRVGGPKHYDALHFSQVGGALARIDATNCAPSTKRAIRFTALTASRQVEVRRATWDQLDLEAAVWVKPAQATKTAKSHRVPLSRQALDVLAEACKGNRGALVFPGTRPGAMMGNVVMTQALRNAGVAASGHGFRSSFKGWAREHDVDELLSEFALAHVEGSATVAAYARDDLLEKRRPVMQAWAECISG